MDCGEKELNLKPAVLERNPCVGPEKTSLSGIIAMVAAVLREGQKGRKGRKDKVMGVSQH